MGTKHIVPRAEGQGGIGTATLGWGELFITNTTADSSTQGGKLTLTSNDGAAMQDGSRLGVIEFKGAESSSTLTIGARIEAICDAAWTATENGTSLKFFTTDADASESLVLTLDSNKLATFTGNVVISGNMTVNGTTTTVNSTIVTIDDPVFTLGGDTPPASETTKDKGIEFRYHTGSAAKIGFFGWDDSASSFTFIADATNNSEVFSGSAGNAIFGNITGTLQTAAQGNVTSLGTLTTLTVDNVIINGTTIGHTSDTDLITLASGALTVAGTLKLGNNTLVSPNAVADDLVIDPGVASVGLSILSSGQGAVNFGDAGNNDAGAITYVHSSDSLILTSNATNVLTFDNSGAATFSNNILLADGERIGCASDGDLLTFDNGILTVAGELDATSLDISGDADIDGTLEADAITVNDVALNTVIAGVTVTNATNAATVTGAAQSNITSLGTLTALTSSGNITGSRLFSGDGGNKTNPMIANGSDQDTGIFFPAANTMAFSAGDTESFRIAGANATFAGNVTVNGSSNPALDVQGTAIIRGNSSSHETHYFTTAAANVAAYHMKDASGNIKNTFSAGGDNFITGGNLGIGTTSPDQAIELESSSNLYLHIDRTSGAQVFLGATDAEGLLTTSNSFPLVIKTNNTTTLTLDTSQNATFAGNVTIGSNNGLILGQTGIVAFNSTSDEYITAAADKLYFGTGNLARLTIDGANVGIGDNAFNYYANRLVVKAPDEDGVTFLSAAGHKFYLAFADGTSSHAEELAGMITFDHNNNQMALGGAAGYEWITLGSSGDITFANTNGNRLVSFSDNQFYLSNQTAWNSNVQGGTENRLIFEGRYRSSANDVTALGEVRVTRDSTGDGYYGGTMQFYTRVNGGSMTKALSIFSDQRVAAEGSVHAGHDGSTGSSGAGTATVGATIGGSGFITGHRTDATCLYIGTTTTREVMAIFRNTDQAGKIRITGTSTVAFESGSDYRLKEDLKDFNGLDIISKLKVYNFNWIGEDRRDHGLLAHEVQEVLPDLVSGEKDGVLENGKIDKQTLDYGRFTPMLIKAVQEQQAVIEDLKARIEVLEG